MSKETHDITVPIKNEKAPLGISFKKYPILDPHEILSYLWDEVGVEVSQSELSKYWSHAWEVGEEWACRCGASEQHVPIGLHGDAARLWSQNKFEKVVAISLNVCHFRPRCVRFSRWVVFSCNHHEVYKNRTFNAVWRRIIWSLEAAFDGLHPTRGFGGKALTRKQQARAGQPLSRRGTKWALCELRGDWEWHVQVWRPTASWQGINVCFKCPAVAKGNDPRNLYWNHGEECAWHSEEFGLDQFVARRLKDRNLCGPAGSQ